MQVKSQRKFNITAEIRIGRDLLRLEWVYVNSWTYNQRRKPVSTVTNRFTALIIRWTHLFVGETVIRMRFCYLTFYYRLGTFSEPVTNTKNRINLIFKVAPIQRRTEIFTDNGMEPLERMYDSHLTGFFIWFDFYLGSSVFSPSLLHVEVIDSVTFLRRTLQL